MLRYHGFDFNCGYFRVIYSSRFFGLIRTLVIFSELSKVCEFQKLDSKLDFG